MAIISFALTAAEFLRGAKTVTRRDWRKSHLARWQRWWDEGRHVHEAWNQLPVAGGRLLGRFRLTCRPYRERLADMPVADLAAEGGTWSSRAEFFRFIGKRPDDIVCVIRFEKLP